jgi:hypothetical protein
MIRVEPATAAMFAEVAPLLDGFHNAKITRTQWGSLFDYPWPCTETARGFVLRDDGRCVGFFGTIWSERTIDGRRERLCNLTSWITLPEYRHHSLLLLKSVLALGDCTITCHSPAPHLYPIYKKFGFRDLETHLRIVLPWPSLPPRFGLGGRLFTDPAQIAPRLGEAERLILEAHRVPGCGHLLIESRRGSCYLVFTRTRGRRRYFSHLHYIGTPAVFVRFLDRLKLHLLAVNRTPLIMLDARLAAGLDLPHSRVVPLGVPHVFRSSSLTPEQIDNLYSELILLGL